MSTRSQWSIRALVGSALLILGAGCTDTFNDIIDVVPQDRVAENVLFDDPAQAALLTTSMQAQFECSYGTYVMATALLGGEANSLGNTQFFSLDRRDPDPAGGFNGLYATTDCTAVGGIGVYTPLSSARWFGDKVLGALQAWTDAQVPNRNALIGQTAAYTGYSLILLGEGFCSGAIDLGPELTPAQMFAAAEQRFTTALATVPNIPAGAAHDDVLAMASVGRARARINQGKNAEALADAQTVSPTYVKAATRSLGIPNRENPVFVNTNRVVSAGIAPEYWHVLFAGVPDPRVPADSIEVTTTNVVRFGQHKYTSESTSIPFATGREAQLIMAEIQGGQQAVDLINAIHAANGLPPFASADPAEIQAQVIEERRRQFFLEGHRSYDRIRFNIPLVPAPGSLYRWGGSHGSAKCMPLPNIERDNNPNI